MTAQEAAAIRARLEWIRGMCTDEAPHTDIDKELGTVLDLLDAATHVVRWIDRWRPPVQDGPA